MVLLSLTRNSFSHIHTHRYETLYIHYHVTENKHSQKRIAFTSNDDNQVKLKSPKVRAKRGRCENTLSIVMAEGMRLELCSVVCKSSVYASRVQ